jgi:hypothetical protein
LDEKKGKTHGNKRNGGFAFWMKKKARPMEIKKWRIGFLDEKKARPMEIKKWWIGFLDEKRRDPWK